MKLSMSIIARELPFVTLEKGSGKLRFERCEVLCSNGDLEPDVLYLTRVGCVPCGTQAANGSGAVCVGRVPLAAIPGAEILTVDEDVDVIELVNAVNAIFHKYNALELKLHEAVSSRADVRRVISLAAPIFGGNELLVCDSDFRVLAQTDAEINALKISGLPQPADSILPEEMTSHLSRDRNYSETKTLRVPFMYEPGMLSCRIIGMNVFYRNEYACRVILSEDKKAFQPHDMELLGFVSGFIQQIYDMAVSDMRLLPKNRLAELLAVMISGGKYDAFELEEELRRRSWHCRDPYASLCIQADTMAMMNKTQPYFCNLINKQWADVCAIENDGYIVCLLNLKKYSAQPENFLSEKVEQFRDMCFRVGISDVFCDMQDLYYSYRQSKIALRTGLKKNPLGWRYSFSNYSLDYVFSQITIELDPKHIASWRLRLLIDHDRDNKTEYCRTLCSYINSGMNAMQCARNLYIHRTTMVYRLNRIKEMTGLNLTDTREILYIHLSIGLLWDEIKRLEDV